MARNMGFLSLQAVFPILLLSAPAYAEDFTAFLPTETEVAQALPEVGPIPGRKPSYEGVEDDAVTSEGNEADDRPTDDPYETARRAVREGMKRAAERGRLNAQQAINDPETQKYQERYIRGYGAAPQQVVKQMMDKIDPERKMSPTQRNMLAYANTYRFFYEQGEPEKAKEAAVSLLQYNRQAAQQYLALGQAAAMEGNIDQAAAAAVKAYANIPNGRDMQIKKVDGGYEISVTDIKTGKPVTKKVVPPNEFAAAAAGFNPATFDEELMNAAGVGTEEFLDISIEDRSNVASNVERVVKDYIRNNDITSEEMYILQDIATSISSIIENDIAGDAGQAVRFAAKIISNYPDGVNISTVRGNLNKVRVTTDGQTYFMSSNLVGRLSVFDRPHSMTYEAWSKRPSNEKSVYTFGVIEASGIYSQLMGHGDNWDRCISRDEFSNERAFFDGLRSFVEKRKEFNELSPAAVLILHINNVCGFLPDEILDKN